MAVFEYMRISLGKPEQKSFIGSDGQVFKEITRREYLDRIFERKRVDFEYSGNTYAFINDGMYDDVLVGRIGKQVLEAVHKGPDQNFAIEMSEDWKPAWTFIDFSKDSQLAVVQAGIASPKRLLRAMFDKIETELMHPEYEAYIENVSEPSEFWDAAEKYAGRITRLEFKFVPPNALGLQERIRQIVEAGKEIGSETTTFSHSNSNGGIKPEGEYIDAALETSTEGAGSVKMKVGLKTIFSSDKNKKTKDLPNGDVPTQRDDKEINSMIDSLEVRKSRE